MKNYKIIKYGYKIDLNRVYDGFFMTEVVTIAENKTKAKTILFDKIKKDNLVLNQVNEPINKKNIPVIRAEEYDKVLFENKEVVRWKIPIILAERKRKEEHDNMLKNPNIKYCYIYKDGYYRPNYAGYTDNKVEAGIYLKEDALDSAKSCNELRIIPINVDEHNQMILNKINKLSTQLIDMTMIPKVTPITTTIEE